MTSFMTTVKMTDRPVVASCLLGSTLVVSPLSSVPATGVSAGSLGSSAALASLPVMERIEGNEGNERRIQAPAVAAAQAHAYGFAASGAGFPKQTTQTTHHQHHSMWAFRGLEPWSDPA